jgi:uncharacterized protein with HEPN domain
VTRERWDADRVLRDAVLYRMLLLGEIASARPDDFRDRYPDVAWRQTRVFRNLAVHRYFSVDWAVVWKIAQEEPLVLEEQALAIIRAEFPTWRRRTVQRQSQRRSLTPAVTPRTRESRADTRSTPSRPQRYFCVTATKYSS